MASRTSARAPARRAAMANNTMAGGRWSAEVERIERELERMTAAHHVPYDCRISFFEVAGDSDLHVNVTQQARTTPVKGWAGPGDTDGGFVYNRRFRDEREVLKRIREVIFAARA